MAKWNVIKRNVWTCEERIVETAPDATIADRIAMRILLDQPNYVAWIEPVQGWTAETKRAVAIAEKWKSWRTANEVPRLTNDHNDDIIKSKTADPPGQSAGERGRS